MGYCDILKSPHISLSAGGTTATHNLLVSKYRDRFLQVSTFLFTLTPPPHILCSADQLEEQQSLSCKTSITFTRSRPTRPALQRASPTTASAFGLAAAANILKVPHHLLLPDAYRSALNSQCLIICIQMRFLNFYLLEIHIRQHTLRTVNDCNGKKPLHSVSKHKKR